MGEASAEIGGEAALVVNHSDGSAIAAIPAGEVWTIVNRGTDLALSSPEGWRSDPLETATIVGADPSAPVRVNGKLYRGALDVFRDPTGLIVVNRVGLEAYLAGVVSAEMGRRSSNEQEALRAQAVVSRTYALRSFGGKWRKQGFDVSATLADQVYLGVAGETPEGRTAVDESRGLVLTYQGAPIDAFFYSTCGGRTADGVEVFRGASRPYLKSIPDQAGDGSVYCSISPRYRWHEEWSGPSLRATLQRYLPRASVKADEVSEVTDIRVGKRSGSGRVEELVIDLGGSEIRVDGPTIRQVLRPSSGELLRSTAFNVDVAGAGRSVTRLAVDGAGAGHGVGFCQWGAVGRARAGQSYDRILEAYFPGTRLERRY
jgi:stage II sporulation protein D